MRYSMLRFRTLVVCFQSHTSNHAPQTISIVTGGEDSGEDSDGEDERRDLEEEEEDEASPASPVSLN